MGKDLKAENLTISLPNHGCNKNCPYCISKMTGYVKDNFQLMLKNATKVANVARAAEVTSVMFTGKGEPLKAVKELIELSKYFKQFPIEIQTNGTYLYGTHTDFYFDALVESCVNVVAISIDSLKQFGRMGTVFSRMSKMGMIPRVTLNLTNQVIKKLPEPLTDLVSVCKAVGIRQLTFRRIVSPEDPQDTKVSQWIKDNTPNDAQYVEFNGKLKDLLRFEGRLIRTLNSGMKVWDVDDVSISHSDYCLQERDTGDDLRSLVFLEDGHLYTSWNSKASVLF